MKKKDKIKDFTPEDRINSELARMKHKDLQRECILRGIEFHQVVEFSHHQLASWFYKNYDLGGQPERLLLFDTWMEDELQKRGYKKGDAVLAPCFRLSFVPPDDEINVKVNIPKDKPIKTPLIDDKPKRKKDEALGVTSGTKKHLTYTLCHSGKSIDEVQKLVLAQFPEANDRSIAIWYKNAKKAMK